MNPKVWLLLEKAWEDIAAAQDVLGTPRAEALRQAFGQHFAKSRRLDPKLHRFLLNASEKRIASDYDVTVRLRTEDVQELLLQAEEFVGAAQHLLSSSET